MAYPSIHVGDRVRVVNSFQQVKSLIITEIDPNLRPNGRKGFVVTNVKGHTKRKVQGKGFIGCDERGDRHWAFLSDILSVTPFLKLPCLPLIPVPA